MVLLTVIAFGVLLAILGLRFAIASQRAEGVVARRYRIDSNVKPSNSIRDIARATTTSLEIRRALGSGLIDDPEAVAFFVESRRRLALLGLAFAGACHCILVAMLVEPRGHPDGTTVVVLSAVPILDVSLGLYIASQRLRRGPRPAILPAAGLLAATLAIGAGIYAWLLFRFT
jgi:hypothetical protein